MSAASTALFRAAPASAALLPARTGMTYAIGDIHGMDNLLAPMLAAIEADAADHGSPFNVVFLGDVVNRGPQTRQVLQRIIAGPVRPASAWSPTSWPLPSWIVLRGNHEQAMLDALTGRDEACFERWLRRGGMATLESYGGTRADAAPARARSLVGEAHLDFLASLPLTYVAGDHLFVHAGVEPGVALAKQSAETLMNVRERFLKKRHKLPYTVVHGHTPTDGDPLIGPSRIGVDTGACVTGILTSIVVDASNNEHRFLRVKL